MVLAPETEQVRLSLTLRGNQQQVAQVKCIWTEFNYFNNNNFSSYSLTLTKLMDCFSKWTSAAIESSFHYIKSFYVITMWSAFGFPASWKTFF